MSYIFVTQLFGHGHKKDIVEEKNASNNSKETDYFNCQAGRVEKFIPIDHEKDPDHYSPESIIYLIKNSKDLRKALFVCLLVLCAGVCPLPTGSPYNLSSDRQISEGPWGGVCVPLSPCNVLVTPPLLPHPVRPNLLIRGQSAEICTEGI